MRGQSLADLHDPFARVSLHGQRPPPQDAPLFTPKYKPLLKGKAHQGFGMHASIGMAKAAVNGLMLSLAAELAPGIRVNCIAPSLTQTPLSKSLWQNEAMAQSIAALHPIARLGQAEDIAGLAAFLLSTEASWITGQRFGVDGGRSSLRVKG